MENTATIEELGFSIQLPAELQDSRLNEFFNDPVISSDERVRLVTELVRQNSLLAVKEISEQMATEAMKPTTSVSQKLSILETHMKLAGVDKRPAEAANPAAGGFNITINIPDSARSVSLTNEKVVSDVGA